jgi:TonB family protein
MMNASRRPSIRSRRPRRAVRRERFARLVLSLPEMPRKATRGLGIPLAFLLLGGFSLGVWWPREASRPADMEGIFVISEEVLDATLPYVMPPPAPQIAPTSRPKQEAPRKKQEAPRKKPAPKPRSVLEEEEANPSEAGDLIVARKNTQAKEIEEDIASPLPSPPSAPVFLDQQPGILKGAPPEYPPRALERGLEGTVVALVTIDTNGRVTDARIEQSAGKDFDGPVLEAVRRLSFQPIIRDGRRLPARFRIPYEFRLE